MFCWAAAVGPSIRSTLVLLYIARMETGPTPFPNGPIRGLRLLVAWHAILGTLSWGSTRRLVKSQRTRLEKKKRNEDLFYKITIYL